MKQIIFLIEYHLVQSGPSSKISLCSADIFLNIHLLMLYSGCNETYINATKPQQTKDIQERYERFKCIIASFDICNSRHFLTEIIKNYIHNDFVFIHGVIKSFDFFSFEVFKC